MSQTTPSASDRAAAPTLPHTRLSAAVDGALQRIGSLASWLWLAIIAAIVVNVVYRYALQNNFGQLEELQWHLYAVAFLIGLSYAVVFDQHVRVDLVYGGRSLRTQAWIDLIGIVVFALPFVLLVLRYGVPFVLTAYESGERSNQPSGLPHRFLIKGALVVGFGLLLAAFVSRLSRLTAYLFGFPRPLATAPEA
ncbi:MAG: TRAP transporter small permease subunit [Alphaproteobacteria bacterium]|jgi:TRAP-type mannitol/chloroaromatic compound transport system permease small subunit|nr:TRAP transporter small permease subunit [Alphaproteobacteria bacterium]